MSSTTYRTAGAFGVPSFTAVSDVLKAISAPMTAGHGTRVSFAAPAQLDVVDVAGSPPREAPV